MQEQVALHPSIKGGRTRKKVTNLDNKNIRRRYLDKKVPKKHEKLKQGLQQKHERLKYLR
jgi:hypothetical protein